MDKLEYVARSLSRGSKKVYENYVVNAVYQKIGDPNLLIETQKEIRLEGGYRPLIDLYLPQLSIAIEVDEGYHAGGGQKERDLSREESIRSWVRHSTMGGSIRFERIAAYGVTLEELNRRIEEVASSIREMIASRSKPLEWKSVEERLEDIKERGTIEEDDAFETNVQIINLVYGKSLKGWQKAGYKLLWFPVISEFDEKERLTDRWGWQNFFNETHSLIYERSVYPERNGWKREWAKRDEEAGTIRIVFVRDRDSFGKARKRFAGVFRASGWDDERDAEIWKRTMSEIRIPIDEEAFREHH